VVPQDQHLDPGAAQRGHPSPQVGGGRMGSGRASEPASGMSVAVASGPPGKARTEPLASCPCFWFVAVGAGLGMKHGRQKSEQWWSDGEPGRSPERQWPMSRVPASTRPLS
jgi:hypothetical protein